MDRFTLIFSITFLSTSFMMMAAWWFARRIDNYSVVDAFWSFGFAVHALIFFKMGSGYGPRKLLVAIMLISWSARLCTFLTRRIFRHHPVEDARYLELRDKYRPHVKWGFFCFYQYQAWSISLLTFPLIFVISNHTETIYPIEFLGFLVWLIGLVGEATADRQKAEFYKDPDNKMRVCRAGLWRYSRHPNYFFESIVWWGLFLFTLGTPNMFVAIYAPLTMMFLLFKVTGIPISERAQLKRFGPAFEEYQRRTSAFFPWKPKK